MSSDALHWFGVGRGDGLREEPVSSLIGAE